MLKTKLIERGIAKLGPIVICQSQGQAPKVLKHIILAFREENQRVTRIVVNA
jgi:hypothetical protein